MFSFIKLALLMVLFIAIEQLLDIRQHKNHFKILTQNIQEIQDIMRRPNLQIIGVDENEDFQLKGPANIFNKIIEENFPNLKKEMPITIHLIDKVKKL